LAGFIYFLEDPIALVFLPLQGMHFDIRVLYIRNVRNLGPEGLKVYVSNVLLKGLYQLDGRLRPRGLSSFDSSVKSLVRAGCTLLRSMLLPRWQHDLDDS